MEMTSLELYGHSFAECFTFTESYRLPREMQNDACLAYIQKGRQEVYSPTQKLIATDNESILMKCGNYIANFENATPTSEIKGVVFHLDPASIKKAFGDKDLSFLRIEKTNEAIDPALKMEQSDLLDSFVSSMMPYFNNPNLANENLLAIKLQELVMILYNGGKNPIATYILGTLHTPEHLVFDVVIASNLYHNVSVSELAHLTNRSESTFKRDFKKFYKTSPAKYLKTKKLERAAELLSQTTKPISEIAWECGFENAAHFSTSFSDKFDKSPKIYRNDLN